MKKLILTLLVIMILSLTMSIVSSCNIGGIAGGLPSSGGSGNAQHSGTIYESDGKFEDEGGDIGKNSEKFTGSEKVTDSESVHTHKFKRIVSEDYLKSEATCAKKAEYYFSCECGEMAAQTFESGDLLPHTEVIDEAVEATCLEPGLTEGKHCSVCKEVIVAQKNVPALGHNYVNNICTRCGEKTEVHEHNYVYVEEKAATCLEKGYKIKSCTDCGTRIVEETPALGHDIVNHAAKAPSCTEEGWNAYEECSRGDYSTFVSLPAAGHTEVIDQAVAATCTKTGLTEGKHCSVCHAVLSAQETTPLAPHTEVIDQAVAATCTKTGLTEGKHCSVCHAVLLAQETTPLAPHTEVIDQAVAPTETTTGLTEGKHCSVCSKVLVAQTEIPALAVVSKGLAYSVNADGKTCTITGKGSCADLDIIIPSKNENGYTVTKIGDNAFYDCRKLTSITIPDGVTSIGSNAFEGCHELTSVNYLGNIESWCKIDFNNWYSNPTTFAHKLLMDGEELKELIIPDSITTLKEYTFSRCSGLTSITIPDSVTSIGKSAFLGCSGLTSITLPFIGSTLNGNSKTHFGYIFGAPYSLENRGYIPNNLKTVIISNNSGVTSIGNSAFEWCSSLTSITIPDSVTSIGESTFSHCSGLTSVTIGNGVTSIDKYAFYGCSGLTSIIIPDSVTSIGDYAFSGCSGLTNITIPDSVTSIDNSTFTHCSGLERIIVSSKNTAYHSDGNCLIDTKNKALILGCNNSVIPTDGSVIFIAEWAFSDYRGLKSITIPDSVTSISDCAFTYCSGLESIIVSSKNTKYHSDGNCLIDTKNKRLILGCKNSVIPTDGSVTSIDARAFYGCTELKNIAIPDSVTSIDGAVFGDCSGLTRITIGNGVTSVNVYAFEGCSGLESIIVSSKNTTYHSDRNCLIDTKNKQLILGCKNSIIPTDGSVTSIGGSAFSGCSGLTSITIPDSVTSIGNFAFSDCSGLTSVTIPDSITSIGGSAFSGCSGLTSITIPDSVTSIGNFAFSGCSGLTSVTIGNGVTSIDKCAFYSCSGLTSIIIPSSITAIGDSAFGSCISLETVYYKGTSEQWYNISILSHFNDYLTSATRYYYSETKPTTSGNFWHYDENGNIVEW